MTKPKAITIIKPGAYERFDKASAEKFFRAEQQVLSLLEKGRIALGEEQLKAKTGFTNEHLPTASPTRTDFTLDDITFNMLTTVRANNPTYSTTFIQICSALELLQLDWKDNVRKDGVRTYDGEPFVRWDYLLRLVTGYLSQATILGVENKFEAITAPKEIAEEKLEALVLPLSLIDGFEINRPGSARLWYRARRFCEEVEQETVAPLKKEVEERSGVKEMPAETQEHEEQIADYLFVLKSVPSPRKEYGKIISRLFEVPQKNKPEGDTSLPIVVGPDNYLTLLEEYRPILTTSLKKWKGLEGKIGELVTFFYGIEDEEKVLEQFPYLPEYKVKRDGEKIFVSIPAIYSHLKALEQDYKTNRLLRRHSAQPVAV
jgi:hypothetical protein